MIKQLAHACIFTEDLDATSKFYFEALDLEKGFDFIKNDKPFGYYVKLGQTTFIEVFLGKPGAPGNINHIAIEVEDMDGLIKRIKSYGYEIGQKKLGVDHSWQVWVTDPNGVRIEFHEYTDKSLQYHGGECIVNW